MTATIRDRVVLGLAAMLGMLATLLVFWPGYLSFDSAYQWWEARHATYSTVHPPLMSLAWSLSERVFPGPGPVFAGSVALYWTAYALIADSIRAPLAVRVLLLWLAGLCPPLLGLLAHVWKDVAVMVWFGVAVALLASPRAAASLSRGRGGAILLCLVVGAAMRHNAITALPPLLFFVAWEYGTARGARRIVRSAVGALLATGLVLGLARIPEYLPGVTRVPAWPAVAAWDMAAVSVKEQRVLLPRELLFFPDDPLPRLTEHYSPATNVPTLVSGGVRSNFLFPYSPEVYEDLRARWLRLPLEHPRAYVEHRGDVAALLFGWREDPLAAQQILQPGIVSYQDNPPLAPRNDPLNRGVQSRLDALVATPWFSGWIWLVLASALVVIGLVRGGWRGRLTAATAASGLCYALPLIVATGSAEFRYLSWLLSACVGAALIALPARRDAHIRATLDPSQSPHRLPQ